VRTMVRRTRCGAGRVQGHLFQLVQPALRLLPELGDQSEGHR
jgi:hypothetical protein